MQTKTLTEQIEVARRKVVSDGYDMSVGELVSLYKNNELVINPAFQRLYRWEESQKTRFIESLLLGIPIPPIFVFQQESGIWELVDGLQRISTILELFGELRDAQGQLLAPLELGGTTLLPALANKRWEPRAEEDKDALDVSQKLAVKRARLRVEILKKESDQDAKFELFQRLNTGGSPLSEQEVRNCVLVMVNKPFFDWLSVLELQESFRITTPLTDAQVERGKRLELVLRFVSYRRFPYKPGLDLNEYLDAAARDLAKRDSDFWDDEKSIFTFTFQLLSEALGGNAFKRWDGERHSGAFLISGFDSIAHGIASNVVAIRALAPGERLALVQDRARTVWGAQEFTSNSGMGVRGTTRLTNLLPFGARHFSV